MIYLNNASTTFPKPKKVMDAVMKYMTDAPVKNSRTGISSEGKEIMNLTRIIISEFFSCSVSHNVFFSSGSTESLNTIIKSIARGGGEFLTERAEHNSVLRPLNKLAHDGNISLEYLNSDKYGRVLVEGFESMINKNTKAIIINLVSNVTGIIQPAAEIFQIAKKYGLITVLDLSQAAGNMYINLENLKCDAAAFTGHKSLYGTTGIGGMIIRKEMELEPIVQGGTGAFSESLLQPEKLPYKFEAGTRNSLGAAALKAGIEWINETGLDNIIEKKSGLTSMLYNEFQNDDRFEIYSAHNEHSSHSVFTFNIKGIDPDEVHYILAGSYDIHVRSGLHCAPLMIAAANLPSGGTVRVSPSFFTTKDEIIKLIDALKMIAESAENEN